jgi:hypothetical protein
VIRRVMPTVIANELVGVQPMTGPVGQIHTLRVRYAQSLTDESAAATSVTAGQEALSPFTIAQAYSTVPQNTSTATAYTGGNTAVMEGTGGKQISKLLKPRPVSCKLVGHLKVPKTLKPCTVSTLKLKSWPLWHKKSQLKLTKRSC